MCGTYFHDDADGYGDPTVLVIKDLPQLRILWYLLHGKERGEVAALFLLAHALLKLKQRRVLKKQTRKATENNVHQPIPDFPVLTLILQRGTMLTKRLNQTPKPQMFLGTPHDSQFPLLSEAIGEILSSDKPFASPEARLLAANGKTGAKTFFLGGHNSTKSLLNLFHP